MTEPTPNSPDETVEYEWATRQPNGQACQWDDEAKARRAHLISKTFPGGEHPLIRRTVGAWTEVQ